MSLYGTGGTVPSTDEASVESLDAAECHRLLTTARIGRLGFTDGAMPAIVPVSFAVHDRTALIPARLGGSLVTGVRGSVVALQVDSYRDDLGPGWSVTVVGPSHVLSDPGTVARLDALGMFPWPAGAVDCYISVRLGILRGWRTGPSRLGLPPAVQEPATAP